jgi:hypothetical protein
MEARTIVLADIVDAVIGRPRLCSTRSVFLLKKVKLAGILKQLSC